MKRVIAVVVLAAMTCAYAELALTQKVADTRTPIVQPVQQDLPPEGAKADEFVDHAPEIRPTAQETKTQMVIFQRPLTEPIWPATKPRAFERVTELLTGWGAQGQYVTLNFAVYPLADLKNLRVQVQVTGSTVQPEIRLVRYWNVIYPLYNSYKNPKTPKYYRRMPEFLMPVTACDAPAREPQRFYLTFLLPNDLRSMRGFEGRILVSHDGFEQAVAIPFVIRVLPFELKQDPTKFYTAYYHKVRSKWNRFYELHKDDKQLVHDVQVAEYRRMKEYGINCAPTIQMTVGTRPEDGEKDCYYIPFMDEFLREWKEAGLDFNRMIPVTNASSGVWLYEKFTGHKLSSFHMHNIDCDKIPQSLYDYMDSALAKFLKYAKEHNYPDMIFNPIDEPSPAALPYIKGIYTIFKKHGCKTFQTSPPTVFIKEADNLFDVYNYGAYHASYEKATSGDKMEYWCYPNDNTFQIKDPNVMCHGGRMTYGLGFWRSGFHCIIPWIWRSDTHKRICNSGGNMLWPETGDIYMTTYWECFRLGVDDLRYIYTLEDAIVRRENSPSADVQTAIREAKALLQDIWNRICPQPAYLRENLMPTDEIDALRAQVATMILKLKAFPETQDKVAPSVIIDSKGKYEWAATISDSPNVKNVPLKKWKPICQELTLKETDNRLESQIAVDHVLVGEEYPGGAKYPRGWPRIRHDFVGEERDFTKFTQLEFDLTVYSDRDVQSDYTWPLSMGFVCPDNQEASFRFADNLEPRVKHHFSIPLSRIAHLGENKLKNMAFMQLYIGEADYPHGSHLTIITENIRLLTFTAPTILSVDAPKTIALPLTSFSVSVNVGGADSVPDVIARVELLDAHGGLQRYDAPVVKGKAICGFIGETLMEGDCKLKTQLVGKDGGVLSEATRQVKVVRGPL